MAGEILCHDTSTGATSADEEDTRLMAIRHGLLPPCMYPEKKGDYILTWLSQQASINFDRFGPTESAIADGLHIYVGGALLKVAISYPVNGM